MGLGVSGYDGGMDFDPADYTEFRYDGYDLTVGSEVVTSHFTLVGPKNWSFTEEVRLPAPIVDIKAARTPARLLTLAQGLSYYKAAVPPLISVGFGLTDVERDFLTQLICGGLGEFAYRNNLPEALSTTIAAAPSAFPFVSSPATPLASSTRPLIAVGGGKDSVVSIETCKTAGLNPMLYSVNQYAAIARCVAVSGCEYVSPTRRLDPLLFELNKSGARNGHVPVTAINSLIGILTSQALGLGPVVMSNEYSASYGNVLWHGHDINHQWSKSLDFENLLRRALGKQPPYFSLLRPLTELEIAGRFSHYPQYFPAFTSCNRSFALDLDKRATHWCCECPKCLFVYLILAAWLPPTTLIPIFGRDILDQPRNHGGYEEILGYAGHKPFECVGDYAEAREALRMIAARPEWHASSLVSTLSERLKDFHDPDNLPRGDVSSNIPAAYLKALENHIDPMDGIWGTGREGRAAADFLDSTLGHPPLIVADENPGARGEGFPATASFFAGPDALGHLLDTSRVIVSPGVPGVHPFRRTLSETGIPLTSGTDLWMHAHRDRAIGVTGTKGKSTTSSLVTALLNRCDSPARLAGNIGIPLLGLPEFEGTTVVELSSYQCHSLTLSPRISVIVNLYQEHLTWHGSLEEYWRDKCRIFTQGADVLVADPETLDTIVGLGILVREGDSFHCADKPLHVITPSGEVRALVESAIAGIRAKLRGLLFASAAGVHNLTLAVCAARAWGADVTQEIVADVITGFEALPHRLAFVGHASGLDWYDDTLSTAPESVIAAVSSFPERPVVLIVGGQSRGVDYSTLGHFLSSLPKQSLPLIVTIPSNGIDIVTSFSDKDRVISTSSLSEAVQVLSRRGPTGAVVLLSPGAPSYDLYANFEEKSAEYVRLVSELM